jgi:hypothetical protein
MTDIRDEVAAALETTAALFRHPEAADPAEEWVADHWAHWATDAADDFLRALAARGLTVVREGELDAEQDGVDAALFRAASNVTTLCLNHGINPREFVAAIEAAREYARLARQPEGQ